MEPWMYILLLGAAIAVIGMLRPKVVPEGGTTELRRNMEDTLEHYMRELEEENEKLITVIERMKKESDLRDDALKRRMDKLERNWSSFEERLASAKENDRGESREQEQQAAPESLSMPRAASEEAIIGTNEAGRFAETYPDDLSETPAAVPLRSRYPELFALLDQGCSEEEAAQRLSMPRGEVQLIIHLEQQEVRRV